MTGMQMFWLMLIGAIAGGGIGVLLTIIAAVQCGYLPGVRFPWQKKDES